MVLYLCTLQYSLDSNLGRKDPLYDVAHGPAPGMQGPEVGLEVEPKIA